MPRIAAFGAALLLFCQVACAPAGALVQVEDPERVAQGTEVIEVRTSARAGVESLDLDGRPLPVTFLLTGQDGLTGTVFVVAFSGGRRAAVGEAPVRLSASAPSVVVSLASACETDTVCSDGLFCTGEERCVEGRCEQGPPPCAPQLDACVALTCVEAEAACAVGLPEGLDDGEACTEDLCTEGTIEHRARPDGTACAGGQGTCQAGRCAR